PSPRAICLATLVLPCNAFRYLAHDAFAVPCRQSVKVAFEENSQKETEMPPAIAATTIGAVDHSDGFHINAAIAYTGRCCGAACRDWLPGISLLGSTNLFRYDADDKRKRQQQRQSIG